MRFTLKAVLVLCLLGGLWGEPLPGFGQAQTGMPAETGAQSGLPDAESGDLEGVSAPRLPLLGPREEGSQSDPGVIVDGRVRVLLRRNSDFRWIYRIENGADESIGSFSLTIRNRDYDSRILPSAPLGWLARCERGEGTYADTWVMTWAAASAGAALPRGRRMEIALSSGAHLLTSNRSAALAAARPSLVSPLETSVAGPSTVRPGPAARTPSAWPAVRADTRRAVPPQLVFPWDDGYAPLEAPLTDVTGKPAERALRVPYPALSFLSRPAREVEIPDAIEREEMSAMTVGQGLHAGGVFQMTLRTSQHVVAWLSRGAVLVPSLPGYDVFIVARTERLALAPQDTATVGVRGYSITYGRKAPPPRLILHDLVYRFANEPPSPEISTYLRIVARGARLVPVLDTPLGERYLDTMVQWTLWRAQRLLAGNPLSVRDVERDLSQSFQIRQTGRGPIKDYLQPLEVHLLAQRIWSDSSVLLSEETPPIIP